MKALIALYDNINNNKMKKITVYCGSNKGKNPIYEAGAKALAKEMISRDLALVYGAGNVGLMGVIADEMLLAGKTFMVLYHRNL